MTPMAIKWLLYDLMRKGASNEEIENTLLERGASFTDLVGYAVTEGR